MWESIKAKFEGTSTEDLVLGFMGVSVGLCFLGLALLILVAAVRYAIVGS